MGIPEKLDAGFWEDPGLYEGQEDPGYKEDSEHQKESIPYEQPRHYEDSGLQEDPGT